MTIEEARKYLDGELLAITLEYKVSSETQKKRLESKFAALNLAVGAIDKQIPKKPDRGVCPNCNSRHIYAASFTKADRFKFCGDCGQALDWSDNEPTKPKGRRMFTDEQIDRILWEIERVNKEQREKELKSTKEGD